MGKRRLNRNAYPTSFAMHSEISWVKIDNVRCGSEFE
jgi:hypothetical protein